MILAFQLPWESIKFVTSGVTLVAFIAAISLYAWRSRLAKDKAALGRVPESDMADLLKSLAERYNLPVQGLAPSEVAAHIREELAVRERLTQARMNLIKFIALLFTFITCFSIWKDRDRQEQSAHPSVSMIHLPDGLSWKQAVNLVCGEEKVTADFSSACDSLFTLKVIGGPIQYAGIDNLIEILTLRTVGPKKHSVKCQATQSNIVQINCQ